jgi:hypothetical protein
MALLCLGVWWIFGDSTPEIGEPWSGWFTALFICALLDWLGWSN